MTLVKIIYSLPTNHADEMINETSDNDLLESYLSEMFIYIQNCIDK